MLFIPANVTYRRLFTAQVVSLIGTGLATVALALLAYDLSGGDAGAVLGTALALKMIAYVLVAPVVGGLAHRLPRRMFLIGLDVARAVIVCCLPFVAEVWQIYLLILLLNVCSAGFTPTFQATIPDVLPDEDEYTRALSLSRLAYDLENLASPTIAAAALLLVSYDALFMFNAGTFLLSAVLLLTVSLPPARPPERERGIWRNTTFGVSGYLRTPRLRGLLALSLAVSAAGAMVIVNTVVYVRGYLGGSELDTALALAGFGAGSMLAALVLPGLLKKFTDRHFMLGGAALLVVGLLAAMSGPSLAELIFIWGLLGMGASLIQTPAGRLIVRSAQPGDRPAYYAAQFALSHACWLIAYPLAGWVGAGASLSAAFAIMALISLLSLLVALWFWRTETDAPLLHKHEAVDHEHLHVHDAHHQHEHEGHEGSEPHSHPHRHDALEHSHDFVIDLHHPFWPTGRTTDTGKR